jgi:hypothetical protein
LILWAFLMLSSWNDLHFFFFFATLGVWGRGVAGRAEQQEGAPTVLEGWHAHDA